MSPSTAAATTIITMAIANFLYEATSRKCRWGRATELSLFQGVAVLCYIGNLSGWWM